jgi:hypothetical protein
MRKTFHLNPGMALHKSRSVLFLSHVALAGEHRYSGYGGKPFKWFLMISERRFEGDSQTATTKNASEKEGLSGAIQMDNPVVDGITGLDTCDNPGHQMPMGASMNEHMPTASAIFGPGRQDATELRELMSG